jgi:hypothetical protein
MNIKKIIIIGFSIFLLIAVIVLIIYVNTTPQKSLNKFSEIIKSNDIDDLSLTIYFSGVFTNTIFSIKDVINHPSTHKIIIEGNQLAEQVDFLKTINKVKLIPVKDESRIDARVYYVFENKGRKIFDVAMFGTGKDDESMYINGKEFIVNDFFIYIVDLFYHNKQLEP